MKVFWALVGILALVAAALALTSGEDQPGTASAARRDALSPSSTSPTANAGTPTTPTPTAPAVGSTPESSRVASAPGIAPASAPSLGGPSAGSPPSTRPETPSETAHQDSAAPAFGTETSPVLALAPETENPLASADHAPAAPIHPSQLDPLGDELPPVPVSAPAPAATSPATPSSPAEAGSSDLAADIASAVAPAASTLAASSTATAATTATPSVSAADLPKADLNKAELPKLEPRPDGSALVDGRFILRGTGTPENPYVVSWDHLVSVQESYDPPAGKKNIPARVSLLDGKHVRVQGFVAFPLAVGQPKEMLAMLNQWDGCCIGVPPTPYDAVEVHLAERVVGEDRFAVQGSVVGKMSVKPYIVGDWLVGLYLLTEAKFTPEGG